MDGLGDGDVDAADGVDDVAHALQADHDVAIDALAEDVADGLLGGLAAAELEGGVDALLAVAGDGHPQVARHGDHGRRVAWRDRRRSSRRVSVRPTCAAFELVGRASEPRIRTDSRGGVRSSAAARTRADSEQPEQQQAAPSSAERGLGRAAALLSSSSSG